MKNDGEVVCLTCRTKLNRTDLNCWKCGGMKLDRTQLLMPAPDIFPCVPDSMFGAPPVHPITMTSSPVPPTGPTLYVSALTVYPGATVTVMISGGPGNPMDRVAKHVSTAPNHIHYGDWKYLDGTQKPPTDGRTLATLTFEMPTMPGTYNFRFFRNDTYVLLATSLTVTVS